MANRKDGKRSNWIKNFGKSVSYSGIDILKELSPSVFETGEQASQSVTSIMKELKDIRTGQKRLMDTMARAPIMKYSAKFVENAIKDLRTGKFNNQDRINKMIEEDMNEGMEDFDFSFDDGDGGSMSFEPSDDTEGPTIKMDTSPIAAIQPGIESTARNTGAIAMGVNQMNSNLQKQSNLIAQEFSNTNKLHGQIATTNFIMQKQFHKENVGHMTAMNENLGKIVTFNDKTIAPMAMGALKYYEDSLTVMNNMLAELQKSNKYMEKEEEEEKEKDQFSLGFTSKGVMKFSNYPEIFKRNFLAAAESDPILSAVKDFVTNEDALKMFAANPLGSVSTMVAGSLIPQMIKTSMKQFDLSLASFFPSLFAKINRGMDSDNPLVSMLSKIFGLNVELHSAPSFSNYKKDAVPFDGITHKTINSVIPNYLSGILAALTGKEEMVMDYESGTFKSKDRLKKDLDDKYKNALLDPFSKVMREMTESIEATVTLSKQMQKDVQDNMETLFTNMAESGKLFNPTSDSMSDLGVTDRSIQKLFKQAMLNMSRGQQMSMNTAMFKARNNTSYLSELEKTPDLMLNYLAAYGGLPFDGHITRQEADRSKYKVNRNTMLGLQEDEYGDTLHSLLRDIKETLMEGITTYPVLEGGGRRRRGGGGGNGQMNAIMRARLDRMKGKKTRKEQEIYDAEMDSVLESSLSSDEVEAAKEEGMITQAELMQMGEEELGAVMKFRRDAKRSAGKGPRQMGGLYEQIDKGLSHFNIGGFFGKIKQGIQDVLHKPLELFTDAIDTIDKGMYTIIYGPDGDGNKSIVTATIESVKSSFSKLTGWMKKRMDSVSEWLFGAKGFMGTKAMEWLVDKKNSIVDYLFGAKNEDGIRKGGAMSDAWNALSDMMLDTRAALFGTAFKDSKGVQHPENKDSIFHNFKDGLIKGFNHLGDYLFGKSDPNKPKKPFLDRITDHLSTGFTNFSNFFFGTKFSTEAGKAEFAQTMDTFKKHLPKALAVGIVGAGVGMFTNFGILGSLILPGGPIGGAILGIAGSFLSQSEQFKKFLFGPKGVDGSRIGGFISKATMNWFTKHKTAILGGAMFGGVKGLINMSGVLNLLGPVGYLGSMILPGGPIGGALMGAAVGLATKTATFQNFLYGKVGAGGAKIGGILNTEFGKGLKKHLPNMAFGALSFGAAGTVIGQMGILGSMLTPGGPIGAAILGAAVGIGISSEKFKRALFGYDDKEMGVHKAGLFQKVGGLISESIVKPFRFFMEETSLNVKYWFIESIANPFRDALEPLRTQFKYMLDGMKNMMKSGWEATKKILNDTFVNAVGKPIGKFLEQDVMKPIRNMMHKLVGGIGKMLGAIISSPFKALGFVAAGFRRSQEQRGVREQQRRSISELFNGNDSGDGFWKRLTNVGSSYFGDKKEAAKDTYAPYRKAEDERIAKRNAETATEKAHQYAELAARRAKADEVRKQRFASGFDSKLPPEAQTAAATATLVDVVDGEGGTNHILKRVYNTLKSGFARLTNNKDFENADRANGFVPLNNTENAIIKAHKEVGVPDELKNPGLARAEEVKAKKAEQAGAPASETGVKKNNGASPIGGLGFDLQMFADTIDEDGGEEAGGVAGTVKKAINRRKNRQRAYRRKKAAAKARQREEQAGKAVGMEEGMVTKYLRIISEAVDGQLDGVGSNVYKIRKMLEESMGMDGDSHGSGNKDRKGFFGRIKGFFRNPISTVVGLLKAPFEYVTQKIGAVVDTIGNVVSAAWGAVKSIGGMVYDVGASVGKALLAIPQAAVDLASSIFAIGKEVAIGGVRILAKASLGLVDGMVTVITGATKAVGHVLEGIGGALKYTFDGLGKLAGGILKGVGTAIDNVVDLAGTIASTTVKMVGSGFQMMGDLAIQGVKAIGKASTAVIDGITSVVSSVAELVASPFKLLGAAARNIIGKSQQHVIVDGGVIDRVKIVEVIQRVDTLGELESAPIPGADTGPVAGSAGAGATRRFRRLAGRVRGRIRKAMGASGAPLGGGMDLQMFASEEGSGIASAGGIASNLTASDLEAGVTPNASGRIQRTASVMSNIKNTLKEKLFMKNNELKQTELLGDIATGQKEHTSLWKKIMGALVPGVLAALAWLKKLKFPTSQVIKDGINTVRQEVLQILEKRFPGAASRFAATKAGAAAMARNSAIAGAARQFGKKVGGVVTKVKDFGIKNMPGLSARFGWKTSGQQALADMVEHDAAMRGGLKAPIEGEVNGKFNMPERPGGISNNQIPKNAFDDVAEFGKPTAQAVESNGESLAAKVRSMFKSGLKTLEQKASKAAGKTLKFADKILEKFLSKITGSFVSRFAGRFTVAIASVAGAVGSLGALEAIFAVWNTTTGFIEAANLFRVNKDAVTVPMRLVASLVKAVTGSPFLAIVNLVLELIAMLLGVNYRNFLCNMLYKFIADDKSIEELEAKQAAFEQEAVDAGYGEYDSEGNLTGVDVDKYNDETNKTIFDKIWDGFVGVKNGIGDAARAAIDTAGGVIDDIKNFDFKDKMKNTLAWFFGVDMDKVERFSDRLKNYTDRVLVDIFGEEDYIDSETGEVVKGKKSKFGMVKEGIEKAFSKIGENFSKMWEDSGIPTAWKDLKNFIGGIIFGDTEAVNEDGTPNPNASANNGLASPDSLKGKLQRAVQSVDRFFGFESKEPPTFWDILLTATLGPVRYLGKGLINLFKWGIGKVGKWIFGDDDSNSGFLADFDEANGYSRETDTWNGVTPTFTAENAKENAVTPAFMRADFSGSGKGFQGRGDFSQNDPRWKNTAFGPLGTMGDSGCGPTAMASVLSDMGADVSPVDMAAMAETGGYRVPGGTEEGFFGDVASHFGIGSTHINGIGDIVSSLARGQDVIVGGISNGDGPGNPFTRNGHYSRVIGIEGDHAIMADPRGSIYSGSVSLSTLQNQMQTGYAFGGPGDGEGIVKSALNSIFDDIAPSGELPRSIISGIKNSLFGDSGIFPMAYDDIANRVNSVIEWFAGGIPGGNLLVTGFKKATNWVLGGTDEEGNYQAGIIGQIYNDSKAAWERVSKWIFPDNPSDVDSMPTKLGKMIGGGIADAASSVKNTLSNIASDPIGWAKRVTGFSGSGTGPSNRTVFSGRGSSYRPHRTFYGRGGRLYSPSTPRPRGISANQTFAGKGPNITGDDIIATAMQYIGMRYVLGGDGVSSTDCGKLTLDVFSKNGLDLGVRTADDQFKIMESHNADINPVDAKPGDLLFFTTNDNGYANIGHVGIYAGNNTMIHAGSSTGVIHCSLEGYWDQRLVKAASIKKRFGIENGKGVDGNGKINGNAATGAAKAKKPKGLMDLLGHIGSIYGNAAEAMIGGKLYTGTSWDDDESPIGEGGSSSNHTIINTGNAPKDIWDTFRKAGFSEAGAAGVLGNVDQESGFNPRIVQTFDGEARREADSVEEAGDGRGYGLAQWTDPGRKQRLSQFANGKSSDFGTQVAFMLHEAEKFYNSVYNQTKDATDPVAAAQLWGKGYEGFGVSGDRDSKAAQYYTRFAGSAGGFRGRGGFFGNLFKGFNPLGVIRKRGKLYRHMLRNGIPLKKLKDQSEVDKMLEELSGNSPSNGSRSSLVDWGYKPAMNKNIVGTNLGNNGGDALPDYSKWTGGEYFNRPEMITAAAKAYYAGTGKIGDMAVSVGLPRFPRSDTILTLEQQMMLGCREYNKVRTWMMFLEDAELRRAQSKKSSADQWNEFHDFSASGRGIRRKDRFSGSGVKRIDTSSLLRSHNAAVGGGSGRFRGGEGLAGASEATLIKAVELLAELVNISGGINAGINNLGENIVVSNRNGTQTRVISLNGGNSVGNQRMMESAKSEYDIHRKIAAGGSF